MSQTRRTTALPRNPRHTRAAVCCTMLLAALATLPAHALYRVVGPDGKVSYTDRPPTAAAGNKVQSVNTASSGVNTAGLPYELRQVAERYPVTLYSGANCTPCDTGRQLLRERGIPYSEKIVSSSEDAAALQRIAGARDLPALTIGSQVLRGLQRNDWTSYLDAAGYPKESKLPGTYKHAPATPLTERPEADTPPPKPIAPPPPRPPEPAEEPPTTKIRF